MPSLRRAARRLVDTLPDEQGRQVRRILRGAQRRVPGGRREPVIYVVSPHPDDETLRLTGFVTWLRKRHPERRVVLVAIGDGGESSQARRKGWTPDYEREYRRSEQAAAWSALTSGAGEIIRVGLWDNTFTAEQVRDALAPLNKRGAQFYIAAHEDDYHADHRAVVAGVRLLNPAHAWTSLAPIMPGKGKVYKPPSSAADGVSIAVGAYDRFGRLSVPPEFRAHKRAGYRSRVTPLTSDSATRSGHGGKQKSSPVFVLGNQKSGTTAIAALLAECIGGSFSSDVLYTHKLQLKDLLDGEPSLAAVARSHPESFRATVVKDNDFTFLYPSLERAFPAGRFVLIVRDPRQNIRSILNRLDLPGNLDSLSDAQYAKLRKTLPGWYSILTGSSFGPGNDHYIDALADRWVRANETYLSGSDRMTLVRYEDFDAAKRPVIERLATDLGFFVVNDISRMQDNQYQPRGDRSVTPEAFFGRANLLRIEDRCAELMSSFGYELSCSPEI